MNIYTIYGSGLWCNHKYIIKAKNKKEAIEKTKHAPYYGNVTISSCRKVKGYIDTDLIEEKYK